MNPKIALVVSKSSVKKRDDYFLEPKSSVLTTMDSRKHLTCFEELIEKAKTKALRRPNIRTVMFR